MAREVTIHNTYHGTCANVPVLPISLAAPADRYDGHVEAIGQVGDYWYARVGHILCGMQDCECGGRDGQAHGERYYLTGPRHGADGQDVYLVIDRDHQAD